MSPLKALRADWFLVSVIAAGFIILIGLIVDGVATGDLASVTGIASVVATVISGAVSTLVIISVKDGGSKGD